MHRWFRRIVPALVESLTPPSDGVVPGNMVQNVARFICQQHRRMPDYLRVPFLLLTLLFDLWPLLRGKSQPFHCLSLAERQRQILAWRCSRLGFRRDFVRFYEGLTVFGFCSFLEVEPLVESADA